MSDTAVARLAGTVGPAHDFHHAVHGLKSA